MSGSDELAHARTKGPLLHQPEIRRRRRISPIWILPIVAVLVAAWLGYTTFLDKGPTITISFKTASGLEPGKTQIKYHDIELGVVQRIDPAADLSHVVVTAQMNKTAAPHLQANSHFWVVKPRLGITSLSGLDTLLSGNYIEMDPGSGTKAERHFTALEEPPVVRSNEPGTSYVVTTGKIGSLSSGSPVFYHDIVVGEVIGYTFDGTQKSIPVRFFVKKPYDALIHEGTQFWNASGISVGAGPNGVKVELESLQAVLAGGIAFETPEAAQKGEPAKADAVFALYDDKNAAVEATFIRRARFLVEFEGSVRGLEVGSPVEVQGIPIGRVVEFHFVFDAATKQAKVPVVIEVDAARIGIVNMPPEEFGKGRMAAALVKLGWRAQLRSGNLLTGQLIVALDIFPDAAPAEIVQTDTYPVLPSVPSQMESLTRSVSKTLDTVAALPLDDIVKGAQTTLEAAQQLLHDTDTRSGPLISSLKDTSTAADALLKSMGTSYGADSQIRSELSGLLRTLQDTARSMKVLASYLEQHPDSLVRGKSAPQ